MMRIKRICLFVGILVFASTGMAEPKPATKPASRRVAQNPSSEFCRAKRWRDRRDLSKQQLVLKLSSMPRERIRQMAWGELLSKHPQPIFPFLFIYLAKTEPNNLLSGYYEGVLYIMNQSIPWRKVAEQWPQPVDLRQLNLKAWTLPTLCKEYQMAGGTL